LTKICGASESGQEDINGVDSKNVQELKRKITELQTLLLTKNRTRVGLVTLATGNMFAQAAVEWFASAQNFFCADKRDRMETVYMVMTDKPTVPMLTKHLKANGTDMNIHVWDGVVKLGWPQDVSDFFFGVLILLCFHTSLFSDFE
jgi:hypothetical protein